MFSNSGYVGYSRSVRSHEAVEGFEVPISMIKKDLIEEFINDSLFDDELKDKLRSLIVAEWKFAAKEYGPASWHHTGKYFNRTDHYNLEEVAYEILGDFEGTRQRYLEFKAKKKQSRFKKKAQFGVAEIAIFERKRKTPKFLGTELIAGVIDGDWMFFKENKHSKLKKINLYANKTQGFERFNTVSELIRAHLEFLGQGEILKLAETERFSMQKGA